MAYQADPGRPPSGTSPKLIGIFVGLGVLGLLIGIGAARLASGGDADPGTASGPATSTQSPLPAETAGDQSSSPATTSSAPNYGVIPNDPASEPGLDFGFLTKVSNSNGTVLLRFDRAYFYTGKEAITHNGGVAPDNDYLIENSNPALRTFAIDPRASLMAGTRLADQQGTSRERLSPAVFLSNAQRATANGAKVPVWLRHTDGLTGQVTALAEQYLP
jgi:hypothetical protein